MSTNTPNVPKASEGMRIRCGVGLVMALTFLCMLACEVSKDIFSPTMTKWESHWLTICLSTLIASACTFFALRRQQRADKLHFLLRLNERNRRKRRSGACTRKTSVCWHRSR